MSVTAPEPGTIGGELSASLGNLRLEGAIFLRAEYTEGWTYESMSGSETAAALRPGARRLVLFHVVAAGRCWITVGDGDKLWAETGDVIVLPYGDVHRMGGNTDAECVPITAFLDPLPWRQMPLLRHGAGGERTDVVCGYLHSDDPLFDPTLRALPPVFVVRPSHGGAAEWVTASINYALAQTSVAASGHPDAPTRLPELLLVEMLRLHLETAPAAEHGWFAALRDPVLAPAMALMHRSPEMKWSVAQLAAASAVSASVLDERFRRMLGRAPIRYLTEWRMHVAKDLLSSSELGIYAISRRVGYDSEEAFSRAFKRANGVSPSTWRANRSR